MVESTYKSYYQSSTVYQSFTFVNYKDETCNTQVVRQLANFFRYCPKIFWGTMWCIKIKNVECVEN